MPRSTRSRFRAELSILRRSYLVTVVLLSASATALGVAAQPAGREGGEEDESRDRLIRRSRGESDDDVMVRIISKMDQVSRRLQGKFDAGEQTRHIQRDILKELDLAISEATRNLRRLRLPAGDKGEQRGEGEVDQEQRRDTAGSSGDSNPSSDAGPGGDRVQVGEDGALREQHRQWGHLPLRDRAEIIQSIDEDYLGKYREQIEKYYEALALPDEEE